MTILQNVFGEAGVAKDSPSDAQERVTDLPHQVLERFLIAGACSLHHGSIQPTLRDAVISTIVY
ncbi:MAG TPA: hypothetical protein VI277_06005 [Candidatus Limnocylindria bacterium]